MNKIFIEAESKKTSEYYFLEAIIRKFFPAIKVQFIFMKGVDNLFNQPILNEIKKAKIEGSQVLVLVDADTVKKGWGYGGRKDWIEDKMKEYKVSFQYFIYPNNQGDGDVEVLMESSARKDLHKTFFDCFEKYEMCVSGEIDESGKPKYNTPNLKGKLHTYMTAQKLSNKQSKRLGSGDWLFDNSDYWNLEVENLQPLKDFFSQYLK